MVDVAKHHAVILTALRVEYQAVRAHLTNVKEATHPQGTVYEQGEFVGSSGDRWTITLVEIGSGNPAAALETERAVNFANPSVLFFVGVAGGIKDVNLCDVVAVSRVYGYESGKAEESFRPRAHVGESAYSLVQRARAEGRKDNWQRRLLKPPIASPPTVHVAPIAAGEKVVASKRSDTWSFLRKAYSDAVAVEMEGRGFLQAAHANHGVSALIVRGISDLITGKAAADAEGYQGRAADAASAFAFEVLSNLEQSAAAETGRYVLVLSATISEFDRERAQAIVAHLRELSEDTRLTLSRVDSGSVKLVLKGSRAGFERLVELNTSGKLREYLGFDVIELDWIRTDRTRDRTTEQMESVIEENLPGARAGSQEALGRLFESVYPYLTRIAHHMLGRLGKARWYEAEDIVGETMLRAYRNLESFQGDKASDFLRWLGFMVRTESLQLARKQMAYKRAPLIDEYLEPIDTSDDMVRNLEQAEIVRKLESAIKSLTADERRAIEFRFFSNMSYKEVAGHMNLSVSSVRVRVLRAANKISQFRKIKDG